MMTQPVLVANQPPPSHYYAENVTSVISRVMSLYGDILKERERTFGSRTLALSTDALRLFARLCTRKGLLFRVDSLGYQEISNLDGAIEELADVEFVQVNPEVDVLDAVSLFPRALLHGIFTEVSRSGTRTEYVDRLVNETSLDDILARLSERVPYVSFDVRNQVDVFSLLFFGNAYVDLSAFVLRDLGLRQYESYEISANTRLFDTEEHLSQYLTMLEQSATYEEERTEVSVIEMLGLASSLEQTTELRVADRLRSHLLNRIGRDLERRKEFEAAISVYERSSIHPARERIVRCFKSLGCDKQVQRSIDEIKIQPWTAEEYEFAAAFGKRFKETELCPVESVELRDKENAVSIEEHAIDSFKTSGSKAWHLENSLPTTLFALAYWDWIFAPVKGAFVNEFQIAPLDLYWPDFFDKRSGVCIDPLGCEDSLSERIVETAQRKRGLACAGVNWDAFNEEVLIGILNAIPGVFLHKVLTLMKKDLRQMSSGFPDLTVIHPDNSIEFVEVKGPGDRLQLNQRIWIRSLMEQQVPVSVLRFI